MLYHYLDKSDFVRKATFPDAAMCYALSSMNGASYFISQKCDFPSRKFILEAAGTTLLDREK